MVYGACAGDRQLLGDAPGQRTRKVVVPVRELDEPKVHDGVAEVGGVNIHAGAAIDGRDRRRLERLCRYVVRPPIAQKRLEVIGDGRVKYGFRHVWRDGTCGVLLDPLDFLARLAALIPPPKFHTLRYHGVLAAHAKDRARVVPGPAPEPSEPAQLGLAFDGKVKKLGVEPDTKGSTRHPWADLMQRVFAHEVLVCRRCKGDPPRQLLLDFAA